MAVNEPNADYVRHVEMLDELYLADVLTKPAWTRARRKLFATLSASDWPRWPAPPNKAQNDSSGTW